MLLFNILLDFWLLFVIIINLILNFYLKSLLVYKAIVKQRLKVYFAFTPVFLLPLILNYIGKFFSNEVILFNLLRLPISIILSFICLIKYGINKFNQLILKAQADIIICSAFYFILSDLDLSII